MFFCAKGRQCIPDVNNGYFKTRDPNSKKYIKYCQEMRSLCHNPCRFESTDTDDNNPTGK